MGVTEGDNAHDRFKSGHDVIIHQGGLKSDKDLMLELIKIPGTDTLTVSAWEQITCSLFNFARCEINNDKKRDLNFTNPDDRTVPREEAEKLVR